MYYIGVDLGGTNIVASLVNEKAHIVGKQHKPTLKQRGIEKICEDIISLCIQLMEKHHIMPAQVKSVGIGAPGIIDREKGEIVYSNNIIAKNFKLVSYMKRGFKVRHIHLPIYLANDADCAALGEVVAGSAKGHKSAIVVTLGTGVGSGIIVEGKIFSGFYPGGAELGHQVIVKDGKACSCGNKGCLEAYASATALTQLAIEKTKEYPNSLMHKLIKGDYSRMTAKVPFDAAKKEDEIAKKVMNEYITYLAIGLTNMINSFSPEVILIGGGVSRQGDCLIYPLTKKIKQMVFGGILRTEIKVATLGNDAGLIGAAMLGNN